MYWNIIQVTNPVTNTLVLTHSLKFAIESADLVIPRGRLGKSFASCIENGTIKVPCMLSINLINIGPNMTPNLICNVVLYHLRRSSVIVLHTRNIVNHIKVKGELYIKQTTGDQDICFWNLLWSIMKRVRFVSFNTERTTFPC